MIQNTIVLEGTWDPEKTSVANAIAVQLHCDFKRSPLSAYAFAYAHDCHLPSQEEVCRTQIFLQENKALLVVLLPSVHKAVDSILRFVGFYEHILPWQFGIVPLLLESLDIPNGRDASSVALEIRTAIGAQRVAQVNVVCFTYSPTGELQILVLKRTPSRGGFWQAITGGIHPNEILSSVAMREVQEETGFVLDEKDLLPTFFSHRFMGGDGYPLVEYVFAAHIHSPEDLQISPEHDTFQWTSVDEARKMFAYESNRMALDHAVETITKDFSTKKTP